MNNNGMIWSMKGSACHNSPESGYLSTLAVNKEREATSIARINPPTIPHDEAAKYSDHATFFAQTILHKELLSSLVASLRSGDFCCTIATNKPEADRATGFVFLHLEQKERQGTAGSAAERSLYSKLFASANIQ